MRGRGFSHVDPVSRFLFLPSVDFAERAIERERERITKDSVCAFHGASPHSGPVVVRECVFERDRDRITKDHLFLLKTCFVQVRGLATPRTLPHPRACVWSWCVCLRPPRCVSTGPVVVRLAEMANERERERTLSLLYFPFVVIVWFRRSLSVPPALRR